MGTIGLLASFAIGFETGLVFIGILLVTIIVGGWILTFMTKRHLMMVVPKPMDVVVDAVRQHFHGIGWREVSGKGHLNYQSRGVGLNSYGMENPVVSVDVEDMRDGTTGVEVWMSEWMSRMGCAASCDRVVSKRWRLARKLAVLGYTSDVAS